jgi:hypothetical protein
MDQENLNYLTSKLEEILITQNEILEQLNNVLSNFNENV